jgi:hypothetical protein
VKERLLSLGFAAAALLLFWALILPKPTVAGAEASRPLAGDAGDAGYRGLERWLKAETIGVSSVRRRFNEPGVLPDGTGHLLLTTMPHAVPLTTREHERLDAWVGRGNVLLVMAALDDTPRWTIGTEDGFLAELARTTRIEFSTIGTQPDTPSDARAALAAALRPSHGTLAPVAPYALFAGVAAIAIVSELPASRWQARAMDLGPLLEVARRSDTRDAAVWLTPYHRGRIIVSGYASPFSNGALGSADNARWLADIVQSSLRANGRVLIDDVHQGLTDDYDAKAFYADPRLHRTLGWLLLLWFLLVIATPPFRPAPGGPPPVDDAALLLTTAGFLANAVAPRAVARRLLEHFFNRIRRRLGLAEDGQPVWDWLQNDARVAARDLEQLRRLHARASAGRRVELATLHGLLLRLSETLR